MKAAVAYAPGEIKVEQFDTPAPGPGEVLVEVEAVKEFTGGEGCDIVFETVGGARRAVVWRCTRNRRIA